MVNGSSSDSLDHMMGRDILAKMANKIKQESVNFKTLDTRGTTKQSNNSASNKDIKK